MTRYRINKSGSADKKINEKSKEDGASRQFILRLLAREWEQNGPPGIMDISDIAGHLKTSEEDVRRLLKPLFAMGAIDTDRTEFAAYLTPEGYENSRKSRSESNQ